MMPTLVSSARADQDAPALSLQLGSYIKLCLCGKVEFVANSSRFRRLGFSFEAAEMIFCRIRARP
jgi:hypothetical protein